MKRFVTVAAVTLLAVSTARGAERPRLAIMDFTTVDLEVERYLRPVERQDVGVPGEILNPEEKAALDRSDLRHLALDTAHDRMQMQREERARKEREIERERRDREDKRARMVSSKMGRRVILGADYMAAALQKSGADVDLVDRKLLAETIQELDFQRSGMVSADTSKQIGQMTGATHLLYGIVDDYNVEEKRFSGYGVEVNNVVYSLNLLVKVVEVETGRQVFTTEATGRHEEQRTQTMGGGDSGTFQKLLKSAIREAARDVSEFFARSGPAEVAAAASNPKIKIEPVGADGAPPDDAEIEIDGRYAGNAPAEIEVAPGTHRIRIVSSAGEWEREVEVRDGMRIAPKLRK